MGLLSKIDEIHNDSAFTIFRFVHTGPSRSNEVTITLIVTPDDDNGPCHSIVYARHEGTVTCDAPTLVRMANDSDDDAEDQRDLQDIYEVCAKILNNLSPDGPYYGPLWRAQ